MRDTCLLDPKACQNSFFQSCSRLCCGVFREPCVQQLVELVAWLILSGLLVILFSHISLTLTSADPLLQLLFQNLPRPENPRTHRCFIDPQNPSHFFRRHFLNRREHQGFPQFFRQGQNQSLQHRADLDTVHCLIGRRLRRCCFFQRLFPILQGNFSLPPALLAPVDRPPPGNARQPGLVVLHGGELAAIPQHAEECLLCGVLSVVMTSQNRVSDAINE